MVVSMRAMLAPSAGELPLVNGLQPSGGSASSPFSQRTIVPSYIGRRSGDGGGCVEKDAYLAVGSSVRGRTAMALCSKQ